MAPAEPPVFYYDLGDPDCYLVAEQIMHALPVVPEWEPVLGAGLSDARRDVDQTRIEHLAENLGLQAMRWPKHFPADSEKAMRAATYAKQIGRGVAFSLAAFRQQFAGGRDLDQDTVLIAGAACEMHPAALLKALERESLARGLQAATGLAREAGVRSLPAIRVGDVVFCGEEALACAAAHLNQVAGIGRGATP